MGGPAIRRANAKGRIWASGGEGQGDMGPCGRAGGSRLNGIRTRVSAQTGAVVAAQQR